MRAQISHEFVIDEHMRQWAQENVPTVNIDLATERWIDYWRANGRFMHDWTAAWRSGMRKSRDWGKDLYTQDEIRIHRLMADFGNKGFRRAFKHENSVMYQVAFDAWDLKRRQVPIRDTSSVISTLVAKTRASQ